jgi:hypothetical protein
MAGNLIDTCRSANPQASSMAPVAAALGLLQKVAAPGHMGAVDCP